LQQETSVSARTQDVQTSGVDAPQPAATKAQVKRKATKDTKAHPSPAKATEGCTIFSPSTSTLESS